MFLHFPYETDDTTSPQACAASGLGASLELLGSWEAFFGAGKVQLMAINPEKRWLLKITIFNG
jgi:hypothetical protein